MNDCSKERVPLECLNKIIVANDKGLKLVGKYVKAKACNTYSWSTRKYIAIGYDTKPDSDWGKYTKRGGIVITRDELFDPVRLEIQKALGWADWKKL